MPNSQPSAIIVGAGWAGLNCAYELSKYGFKVTLIEAAPHIGGRARSITVAQQQLDNGQHIMIGAYHRLKQLITELELMHADLFKILPLELHVYGQERLRLKLPKLPAPLHLLCGICLASNLTWRHKIGLLKFCYKIWQQKYTLERDCSVLTLLQNYHQPDYLIQHFWAPLTLASMTTSVEQASAQVFLKILQQVFTQNSSHSNWYLPKVDLSNLLPNHLQQALLKNGAKIILNTRVKELVIENGTCIALSTGQDIFKADHFILATQFNQTIDLLQPHPQLLELTTGLQCLESEPITTIYFIFGTNVTLPYPMLAMIDKISQWVFDRGFAGQPNVICAVISGKFTNQYTDQHTLSNDVFREIRDIFSWLPLPIQTKVITEKRAAFNCNPDSQAKRPTPQTSVNNLWLAGDYIQTGLPATLEGALISGGEAARMVCTQSRISPRSNQKS